MGARVALINPPSPEALGSPLLGQQYVAAALLAAGHEVAVVDAAAERFAGGADEVVRRVEAFGPDVIGVALFTRWIWHAYGLVERLREAIPAVARGAVPLVAGGAHVTVRPDEALGRGFDVAVIGEAEATVVELVDRLVDGRCRLTGGRGPVSDRDLAGIAGIRWRDRDGAIHAGPPRGFVADLDALAFPQTAHQLYDPAWYGEARGRPAPPGMLTSRGCPARCTFCANYVTGRRFRYRSARNVVAELRAHLRGGGPGFVAFWDDAITADRRRLGELCDALLALDVPVSWTAITRAGMVTRELLRRMREAGCLFVNFGVESGDEEILRAIRKGITPAMVVRALEWAKAEGLGTACNFMLGFPQETPRHIENTIRFMERIAPLVDVFSTLGVLVPFPGTPLYEDYHERHRFTDWWLREDHSRYRPAPDASDVERYHRHYIDDANLELDFFDYDVAMKAAIREALRVKGEHNLRAMGRLPGSVAPARRAS